MVLEKRDRRVEGIDRWVPYIKSSIDVEGKYYDLIDSILNLKAVFKLIKNKPLFFIVNGFSQVAGATLDDSTRL